MNDEYLFLFAQWGVLNAEQCGLVLKKFGSFKAAWHELTPEDMHGMNIGRDKALRCLAFRERISFEWLSEMIRTFDVRIYYIDDEAYPEPLRNIEKPPPFIFVRGKLPTFHRAIAIVGTRRMTDYGRNVTIKFSADLTRENFVVVSGLAYGVDATAHKTVVESGGMTVAVLGSGVDNITPRANYRLAQDIISGGGAIISAYPLGTRAAAHHFPQRNVIISALCQGTLVIEGGRNSGALITAKLAHEQGREVFAIPNNINKFALSGTNHLIRTGQAKLVENIDHILEDFGVLGTVMHEEREFSPEERLLLERLAMGAKSMDDLVAETTMDIPQLSSLLMQLLLKGAVAKEGARWACI